MLEKFVKINSVTKSLTMELIPVGKTRETIKNRSHLETDELYSAQAEAIRPIIDDFIKQTADKALKNLDAAEALGELYEAVTKEDAKAKDISKKENAITKLVEASVKAALPGNYTTKDIKSDKFLSGPITDAIKDDPEKLKALEDVKGKTGLLAKWITTRITALETTLPQRVIENFYIFVENMTKVASILDSPFKDTVLSEYPDFEAFAVLDNYANTYLTQSGINEYNRIISGIVSEKGVDKKGINGLTNEFNVSIRKKKDIKKLPSLDNLKKQILMPAEKTFSIDMITADAEVYEILAKINKDSLPEAERVLDALRECSSEDIYVYGNKIHLISHLLFGDHGKLPDAMRESMEEDLLYKLDQAKNKTEKKSIKKKIDTLSDIFTSASVRYSFETLNTYVEQDILKGYISNISSDVRQLHTLKAECEALAEQKEEVKGDRDSTQSVIDYFGAWHDIREALSYIKLKKDDDINNEFYGIFDESWEKIRVSYKGENLCRNYISKNLGDSLQKRPAFFGSAGRSAAKWKIPDEKLSVGMNLLIRNAGKIYFFCLPAGVKPVYVEGEDKDFEILQIRKMQNPMMIFPKLVFLNAGKFFEDNKSKNEYTITENMTKPLTITRDVYEVYKSGNFKTSEAEKIGEEAFKEALVTILTVYKEFANRFELWQDRKFPIKEDLSKYKDLGEFYADIKKVISVQKWVPGNKRLIEEMTEKGEALMFEITNRKLRAFYDSGDLSKLNAYSKTFLYLLSEDNHENMTMRLNSRPQLTYRKAATGTPKRHAAGSIVVNKRDKEGNFIPAEIWQELYLFKNDYCDTIGLSNEAKRYIREDLIRCRKIDKDIVRDKRFYNEQFSICLSYEKNIDCSEDKGYGLNKEVSAIAQSLNRVIVIRNTQDILYMMVTDPNGNILEKRSLNVIDGIDYHTRLKALEAEKRDRSSKEWDNSGSAKNIRTGYLEKAINLISKAVIEYDAILLLEKIPEHAKDKYYALGNTAYKKFENMLITKLNDLVFKDIKEGEPGSLTNPYQLTYPELTSEWQNGIIYFVSPYATTNTDPDTGFHCDFATEKIKTKYGKMNFLSKFDMIRFDRETLGLEVSFDYNNFNTSGAKSKASTGNNEEKTKWHTILKEGIVVFNKEYKYNTFIAHPFESLPERLKEDGLPEDCMINEAAFDGTLSGKTVNLIYNNMMILLRGFRGACENNRQMYVSPITGKAVDISENTAINLSQKFDHYRSLDKDKKK